MTTPNQHPSTVVKISERLWSQEVARADAESEPQPIHDPAYEFSNGKKFVVKQHYQDTDGNP